MTRKAFCHRFVGLLSIGLHSIGSSKAFSSSRQNGQDLTGPRKDIFHSGLKVKDSNIEKGEEKGNGLGGREGGREGGKSGWKREKVETSVNMWRVGSVFLQSEFYCSHQMKENWPTGSFGKIKPFVGAAGSRACALRFQVW